MYWFVAASSRHAASLAAAVFTYIFTLWSYFLPFPRTSHGGPRRGVQLMKVLDEDELVLLFLSQDLSGGQPLSLRLQHRDYFLFDIRIYWSGRSALHFEDHLGQIVRGVQWVHAHLKERGINIGRSCEFYIFRDHHTWGIHSIEARVASDTRRFDRGLQGGNALHRVWGGHDCGDSRNLKVLVGPGVCRLLPQWSNLCSCLTLSKSWQGNS